LVEFLFFAQHLDLSHFTDFFCLAFATRWK
jgi:hypothetical protein